MELKKVIYCSNCGGSLHQKKECCEPITSFGIIIFKVIEDEKEEINDIPNHFINYLKECNESKKYVLPQYRSYPKIKFLMIQRKDTMSYIDFLRGKYPNNSLEKDKMLKIQFSEMTTKERDFLKNNQHDFDNLWNSLWNNRTSKIYKNEYHIAKDKFYKIDINYYLHSTRSKWNFSELTFPKGRKNLKESNINCAEREFFEETGYEKHMYEFIKNYPLIEEVFIGTNNIAYKHIYYLVKLKNQYNSYVPNIQNIDFIIQQGEISSIGWYNIQECLHLIRDYDDEKKKMISTVFTDITKMNLKFNLCDDYYSKINIKINNDKYSGNNFFDLPHLIH